MRAGNLADAVRLQNDVPFGLTAGFQSLDEREISRWRESVEAGNLYINRQITGAIVQRQPFGGWKKSSVGPGAKAGGPNYVFSFCRFEEKSPPDLEAARSSYARAWQEHFSIEHDPSGLRAESNVFRYRPSRGVLVRLDEPDDHALELARLASLTTRVPLHLSLGNEESDRDLAARLPELAPTAEFLRTTRPPSNFLLRAASQAGLNWIDAPFTTEGRLELRHWLREQAVSETRHRYGNVIDG